MHRAGRSFDHLVGARKERGQDGQTESRRCLQIDNKLNLLGLLHWQLRELIALEDAMGGQRINV